MTVRPLDPREAPEIARRAAVAMGQADDDDAVERWRHRCEAGEVWGLDSEAGVLGHCRLLPTSHWFGGRAVPTLDIASVAVPPEHRGRGVASVLMEAAVAEGRRRGAGLSLLFPATTRLYRRLGWEHAGVRTRYRLDARAAPSDGAAMRTATSDTDWTAIRECHTTATRAASGPAVRSTERWEDLASTSFQYVLDAENRPGAVEAYALFDQRRAPGDWQFTLAIADWAATSVRGLRAVATLIGRHGTFGRDATFVDGWPDLWSLLTPEQDVRLEGQFYWMARALDLRAAIAARGFPPGVSLTVTLHVADPLQPEFDRPLRLEVADGEGRLVEAPAADVRLDVRAVGPLFTGFRHPRHLALAGLAEGPPDALDLLGAAFAGPPPMLIDFF